MRADDGTVTIIQPLIAPLYGGKSAHEVMAALSGNGERPATTWFARTGTALAPRAAREPWRIETGGTAAAPAAAARAAGGAASAAAAPAGAVRRGTGSPQPPDAPATSSAAPAAATATSRFDRDWRQWLHDGVVPNTAFTPKTVAVKANFASQARRAPPAQGLDVVFRPDPTRLRRPLRQQRLAAGAARSR